MPPGSPDVVAVTPYTGYKVRTFHTLYDAQGNVLDRHYEATSTYKPRDQVVRQAPGGGGTSDAPQIPDDPVEEVFVPGLPSPGEPEEPVLPTSDAP